MDSFQTFNPNWEATSYPPRLHSEDLHIWLIDQADCESYFMPRAPDKIIQAAQRLRMEIHRRRFIVHRTAWLELLKGYLMVENAGFQIVRGSYGKPFAHVNGNQSEIQFNTSDSEGLHLVGFGLGSEIGVDIEEIDSRRRWSNLSRRYFHPEEQEYISETEDENTGIDRFFQVWTMKEAYLKYTGEGLSRKLDKFSVLNLTHEKPGLALLNFKVGERFMASICHEKPSRKIRYLKYSLPFK